MKWGFSAERLPGPRYLCCNADESEPGTFKDRQLIERDPHQLFEGMLMACYAISAASAYIYIRGEFVSWAPRFSKPPSGSAPPAMSGKNILAPVSIDIWVHRGAGAYICGKRRLCWNRSKGNGLPRVKPPFPATHGLYNKPTVVNNVETLANLPHIMNRGQNGLPPIGLSAEKHRHGSLRERSRETTRQLRSADGYYIPRIDL